MDVHKTPIIEIRFVIGLETTVFRRVRALFSPEIFMGWGSEGVNAVLKNFFSWVQVPIACNLHVSKGPLLKPLMSDFSISVWNSVN